MYKCIRTKKRKHHHKKNVKFNFENKISKKIINLHCSKYQPQVRLLTKNMHASRMSICIQNSNFNNNYIFFSKMYLLTACNLHTKSLVINHHFCVLNCIGNIFNQSKLFNLSLLESW